MKTKIQPQGLSQRWTLDELPFCSDDGAGGVCLLESLDVVLSSVGAVTDVDPSFLNFALHFILLVAGFQVPLPRWHIKTTNRKKRQLRSKQG